MFPLIRRGGEPVEGDPILKKGPSFPLSAPVRSGLIPEMPCESSRQIDKGNNIFFSIIKSKSRIPRFHLLHYISRALFSSADRVFINVFSFVSPF